MTGGTPARAYYLDTYEQSATADHVTEAGEPEAVFTGVLDATGNRIMRRTRDRVPFGFMSAKCRS